jgi:hypothetical protein
MYGRHDLLPTSLKRKRKDIFCKLSSALQKRKYIIRNFNDSDVDDDNDYNIKNNNNNNNNNNTIRKKN